MNKNKCKTWRNYMSLLVLTLISIVSIFLNIALILVIVRQAKQLNLEIVWKEFYREQVRSVIKRWRGSVDEIE